MMDTVRKHGQTRFFELHFSTTSPAARFESRIEEGAISFRGSSRRGAFMRREIFFVSLPGRGRGRDLIARIGPVSKSRMERSGGKSCQSNDRPSRRGYNEDIVVVVTGRGTWSMKEEERVERGRIEYEGYEGSRSDKSDSLERRKGF